MESFEHIPMIEQPAEMKVDLYPHQLASVYAMEKLERERVVFCSDYEIHTDMGIHADPTGYGKTMSIVALVLRDKMSWDLEQDYITEQLTTYASQHVKKVYSDYTTRIDVTLVLTGPSIIHQWKSEFSHSTVKVGLVTTRRNACTLDVELYDVIIVTPTMFNRLMERYIHFAWKRFVYDEPTQIRVPAMRKIVAGFTWFVTATPEGISGFHAKCRKSFMKKIIGGCYEFDRIRDDITVVNDPAFVVQSFSMPVTHHVYHHCYSPMYRAMNGIVSQRVNQMIEAGNISGAIRALGGKGTDNIADLVKKKKNLELTEIHSYLKLWRDRENEEQVAIWEEREEEVTHQLDELDKRVKGMMEGDCVICRCPLTKPVMEPQCQNIFCGQCLLTWLKDRGSCPMCRRKIKKDQLTYINTGDEKVEVEHDDSKEVTKEDKIIDLVKEKRNGKFIIFSDWNQTFDLIRRALRENNIGFGEVKGQLRVRQKTLEKFKSGKIPVLFLNSKYNGAGINLQETTDIILYHKMDNATTTQVIGRANRIGRKNSLQVHHLLFKDNK